MNSPNYQQCTRCIMDNKSDDTITFDESGHCNYCSNALQIKNKTYFPNEEGREKLNNLLTRLKKENKHHSYDCVMGISGGLDSSYLAYLGSVHWGLRILAVHIDDGFNTEISEKNIAKIAEFPNFDLKIIKPDPVQYKELTKAYMKAGVPNLAVPQDNVLFSSLYKFMKENKLKTFLSGGNYALECILQSGNTHDAYDLRNLKDINKKFGKSSISNLPLLSSLKRDIDTYIFKIESARPLNYIEYNRDRAMKELSDYCDFEYYGSKHLENALTKFIQQYWFYHKFNVDKRTSHLSSMIVSDQMTREEAQKQYQLPLYNHEDMQKTVTLVLNKLGISEKEFLHIMAEPGRQHSDYKTSIYSKVKSHSMKALRNFLSKNTQ